MAKRPDALIKAFAMSGYQITADLNEIGERYRIDIGNMGRESRKRQLEDYDQFEHEVRREASEMSEYYEIFYCLEISIRKTISEALRDTEGGKWWDTPRIKKQIKDEVSLRMKKEMESGVTIRSESEIDYTTFGELSQIIIENWDIFDAIFTTRPAVGRVMAQLNLLRGPIAHCCPMSEDEKDRLALAVKDWFRLMS